MESHGEPGYLSETSISRAPHDCFQKTEKYKRTPHKSKGCQQTKSIPQKKEEGNILKINGIQLNIKKRFDCNTYNLVYAILCKKARCNKVYIGESMRMLWARIADHRGYVTRGEIDKATGAHFTQPGHSLADLRVTVLENTRGKNIEYRKERANLIHSMKV